MLATNYLQPAPTQRQCPPGEQKVESFRERGSLLSHITEGLSRTRDRDPIAQRWAGFGRNRRELNSGRPRKSRPFPFQIQAGDSSCQRHIPGYLGHKENEGETPRKRSRCSARSAVIAGGTVIRRFGRAFSSRRTSRLKRSDRCFITFSS
jgi:hypothetical protein